MANKKDKEWKNVTKEALLSDLNTDMGSSIQEYQSGALADLTTALIYHDFGAYDERNQLCVLAAYRMKKWSKELIKALKVDGEGIYPKGEDIRWGMETMRSLPNRDVILFVLSRSGTVALGQSDETDWRERMQVAISVLAVNIEGLKLVVFG